MAIKKSVEAVETASVQGVETVEAAGESAVNTVAQATNTVAQATNTVAQATNPVAQATNPVAQATNTVAQATKQLVPAVVAGTEKIKAEVTATMEKTMKTAEDLVSFGQGNMEAFVKAGQIWAAGVQDLGKQVAATAQAQVDQTVATFKALAGVKSFKEAVDLQSSLARATMEKAVAETGKLTDASLKLAEQALAPITARVTLAVEKFGRPVA
jgi:phasin family protein